MLPTYSFLNPALLSSSGAASSSEEFPIEHWSLLRLEPLWAFDAPLMRTALDWAYFSYPTAAWYLRRGHLTLRFPSGEERYAAGQWIFPRQTAGRQFFSEDAELLSIRFYAEWRNGQPLFSRKQSVSFFHEDADLLLTAAEPLARYVQDYLHPVSGHSIVPRTNIDHFMALHPLFANWVNAYYRTFVAHGFAPEVLPPMGNTVRSAIAYLQSRPLHLPFHEQEVARHVGLSLSHLNRLFAKEARTTPYKFLNYRRLEAAQTLLLGGKEQIKQISYSLGFATPEAFTHWFRRESGYSPREFRRVLR